MRRPSRVTNVLGLVVVGLLAAVVGKPEPTAPDAASVDVSAVADRAAVEPGVPTTVTVRVRVEAASRVDELATPLHLAVLLDTSGSMAGEPIEQAKSALHALVDDLRPTDRLSIVTFDSRAIQLVPPVAIDDADITGVHDRIDGIVAQGTTDLSAGLSAVFGGVGYGALGGHLNRMVIIGDGIPNDPSPIPAQVEAIRRAGFSITALGVGLDYDEVLFGEMTRATGGRFHHLEGDGLVDGLAAELMGAQRQVAGNVHMSLSSGPGVSIRRVVGLSPDMLGAHRYDAMVSDLSEGELQDVFVELDVTASRTATAVELLDAVVTYDDRISTVGRVERRAFISLPTSRTAAALAMRDDEVVAAAIGARAAAATIEAIALARSGEYAAADTLLAENDEQLVNAPAAIDPRGPAPKAQLDQIRALRREIATESPNDSAADAPRLRAVSKEANEGASGYFQAKR